MGKKKQSARTDRDGPSTCQCSDSSPIKSTMTRNRKPNVSLYIYSQNFPVVLPVAFQHPTLTTTQTHTIIKTRLSRNRGNTVSPPLVRLKICTHKHQLKYY